MTDMRRSARTNMRLAVVLVAALLSAQWAGLQHRIAHGLSGTWQVQKTSPDESAKPGHSCILLDAAMLAAGAAVTPLIMPAMPPRPEAAPELPWRSWLAPFARRFAARAPPSAFGCTP